MTDNASDSTDIAVESRPERPTMIYDGDCGFCTYWAKRWRDKLRGDIEIAPFQNEPESARALARTDLEEAVHLVEPDGAVFRGAAAVFRALARRKGYAIGWWLYRFVPGFRTISEWVYRWVADHRMEVSRWTRWMRRDDR